MNSKKHCISLGLLLFIILLNSFTDQNPYFVISHKDVELKTATGFPAPVYDFKNNSITPEGFLLGRKLFYDPVLSKDSSTSCGGCHQRFAAFAHIDHALSHGINGLIGNRNVPAIQNMIWQDNFMWDGGVNHMEMQPVVPITSPKEMDETLANVIQKLQGSKEYVAMFNNAFHDSTVTSERMLKAISQFVGLMISTESRYDKFRRGEDTLSAAEMNGLKIFRSHCVSCHKEPLFTDKSFRNTGLKFDASLNDSGRAGITGLKSDFMKFRVPSLRNVEMTYPYMHDGRFKDLDQVLDHYASGKFADPGFDSSLVRNIGLSAQQRTDVIIFLRTLTDRAFLFDRRFADPNFRR